jgi:translation elongation factor aEF-1 beta
MAGMAAVIAKVMLDGPDTDLESVKVKATEVLDSEGAKNISYEVQELAFGLKALMAKMAWDEEKETELIVEKLKGVEGISEVDIVDYRRAFG